MNTFNILIRNVVICVILMNIIDALIISRSFKKYIKLFCGFLLIILVVCPSTVLVGNLDKIIDISDYGNLLNTENWGDKKMANRAKRITNVISDNKEKVIEKYIKNKYKDVDNVRIKIRRTSDKIEKIMLRIKMNTRNDNINQCIEDIKCRVSQYYKIMEEQVEIRIN